MWTESSNVALKINRINFLLHRILLVLLVCTHTSAACKKRTKSDQGDDGRNSFHFLATAIFDSSTCVQWRDSNCGKFAINQLPMCSYIFGECFSINFYWNVIKDPRDVCKGKQEYYSNSNCLNTSQPFWVQTAPWIAGVPSAQHSSGASGGNWSHVSAWAIECQGQNASIHASKQDRMFSIFRGQWT